MERGRTDYLRLLGVDHRALFEETEKEAPGFHFVVRSMTIEFLKPARMDDVLDDRHRAPSDVKGASITLHQRVTRGGEISGRGAGAGRLRVRRQGAAHPQAAAHRHAGGRAALGESHLSVLEPSDHARCRRLASASCNNPSHELVETRQGAARLPPRQPQGSADPRRLGADRRKRGRPASPSRRPRAGPASARPRRTGISATATSSCPTSRAAASNCSRRRLRAPGTTAVPTRSRAFDRLGKAYLAFARSEPAYYSAMFEAGLSLDDQAGAARRPATARSRCCARATEQLVATMPAQNRPPVLMMALHIWALSHGIASLFGRGDAGRRSLPMSPEELLEAARADLSARPGHLRRRARLPQARIRSVLGTCRA